MMCNEWEKTEQKLVHVISLVVKGDIEIKDEILLDKLLQHVQKRVSTSQSTEKLKLVYDKEEFSKITEALSSPDLDVTCNVFGLRLIGILFESADNSFVDEGLECLVSLVRHWTERSSSPETTFVAAAGLEMLVMLIQNDVLLEKIVTKELINAVVNCLQSKNVYVSTGAQKFLSQVISKTYGEENRHRFPRVRMIAQELSVYLLRKLVRKDDTDDSWIKIVRIILPIIKSICEENNNFVRSLEMRPLLNVLSCRDKEIGSIATRILSIIVCSRLPMEEHVCDVIQEVRSCGDIYIEEFASYLLAKSSMLSEPTQLMLQSILLQSLDSQNKNLLRSVDIIKIYCVYITRKDFQEQTLSRLRCLLIELLQKCQTALRTKTVVTLLDCIPFLLNTWTNSFDQHSMILNVYVSLLKNQSVTSKVLMKLMKNVELLLDTYMKASDSMSVDTDIWNCLSALLAKFLSHLDWDVRDSAIELTTHLVKVAAICPEVGTYVINHRLPNIIWEQLLFEEESFVRSSVFTALEAFSVTPIVWDYLISAHSQESIVKHVIYFASEDTEAIVRRTAYKLLLMWFSNPNFSDFRKAFVKLFWKATFDSDWEVKMNAVEFWNTIYLQTVERHLENEHKDEDLQTNCGPHNIEISKDYVMPFLNDLNDQGWCGSLLSALEDCDISVSTKAELMLLDFKKLLLRHELMPNNCFEETSKPNSTNEHPDADSSISYDVVPFDSKTADEVLTTSDKSAIESIMHKRNVNIESTYDILMNTEIKTVPVSEFLATLSHLKLDVNSMQTTSDIYENNVLSLLDDLLLSASTTKNNVLDCY